jgi:hypothetical protein
MLGLWLHQAVSRQSTRFLTWLNLIRFACSTCDDAVVTQAAPNCFPTSPKTNAPRESFRACVGDNFALSTRNALRRIRVNLFVTAYSEYEALTRSKKRTKKSSTCFSRFYRLAGSTSPSDVADFRAKSAHPTSDRPTTAEDYLERDAFHEGKIPLLRVDSGSV